MGSHVDDQTVRAFQREVRQCLPQIRERLGALERTPENRQLLSEAHQLIQTVSSAASMLGLAAVCESAAAIEQFLSGAAQGGEPFDAEAAAALAGVIDEIEAQVADAGPDDAPDPQPPDFGFEFDLDEPPATAEADLSVAAALEPDEPTSAEFLEVFQEEAQEHLAVISSNLRDLERDPQDDEKLQEVRRAMHTLKGAAGTIGLRSAQHVAHHSEDLLDRIAEGRAQFDPRCIPLFFATADVIQDIADAGCADERALDQVREISAQFEALSSDAAPPPALGDLDLAPPDLQPAPGPAVGAAPADDPPVEPLQPDDPANGELLEIFQEEAEEHVTLIAGALRDLERNPGDKEALQELRRSMHTLKGAAGMVGLRSAQRVAHHSEDLLDRTVDSGGALDPEVFPLLFATADVIEDIARAGCADDAARQRVLSLTARFAKLLTPKPGAAALPSRPSNITADDVPADSTTDPELLEVFQEEAEENLVMIDERLAALAADPASHEDQKEMRRAMHTLKGAGGMVGLHSVHWIAKKGEYLMNDLLERQCSLSAEAATLLRDTAAVIGEVAQQGAANEERRDAIVALAIRYESMPQAAAPGKAKQPPVEAPPAPPEPALKAVDVPAAAAPPAEAPPPPAPEPAAVPAPTPAPPAPTAIPIPAPPPRPQPRAAAESTHGKSSSGQYARVPLERVEELVRLVSELIVSRSAFEQHYRQFAHEGGELRLSAERLKRLSMKLENDYAIKAMSGAAGGPALFASAAGASADSFDELEFDRYSEFHLLSRDLTETTADVTTAGSELKTVTGEFQGALARLSRLTSEVQDGLMRLRMSHVSSLENRLHRTVRVAAQATGKKVRLEMDSGDVELDKTVIEEMTGPFEHLLRNGVDHGIESPAERTAHGKSEEGSITFRAYLEGSRAMIEISDDGAGLNADLLREKAIERGIYSEAQAAALSEEEAFEIIFHPGFSTAKTVSEVSGRGVGMDVVRSTINSLNGSMVIRSEAGKGTTFEIRLPTTLAVARVVMLEANRQVFAAPVHAIRHVLRLAPEQVEQTPTGEVVSYEGRRLRAIRLADALNLPGEPDPKVERPAALIVEAGERSFVILADRLHEASEVVVKSLGGVLGKVHGINAATIAGDGSVVLIINPAQLAVKPPQEYAATPGDTVAEAAAPQLEVLVVDDSLSVRRVVTKVLENAGWKPIQARDGVEALETLQKLSRAPDAVLLDVEMPRMDGYELTSEIRAKDAYKNLPLIMLTSRAGQKHRDRAKELGVTDYLVKPFQEEALLGAIQAAVHASRDSQ